MPVPIPALAPTLYVESELFGHVRGAFTEATRDKKGRLEMADQGVLFLDEIGDVEPALQKKLLRFLDSGELFRVGDTAPRRVDALVVSATNRPLEKDVEAGRFRADLLARLGHAVVIPPLRERPGDVPLLVDHMLARVDRGPVRHRFVPEALDLLQRHHWPFNVRELQQVVERAVCLVDGEEVRPERLPDYLRQGVGPSAAPGGPPARCARWSRRPRRPTSSGRSNTRAATSAGRSSSWASRRRPSTDASRPGACTAATTTGSKAPGDGLSPRGDSSESVDEGSAGPSRPCSILERPLRSSNALARVRD